jgi:hypothetical protein
VLPAKDAPDIEINAGLPVTSVEVANSGDRPIQVGSHYHFFETNPALRFDRALARGMRLNIPAGHRRALRAGADAHGGARPLRRRARGVRLPRRHHGAPRQEGSGAKEGRQGQESETAMSGRAVSRRAYAEMYGPTVGDRVRLADTALTIEVEEDRTRYGEEVKFGGGR